MGASPVPVQMWQGRAQSRCGCGRGERSPGADVAGVTADHLGDGPGVLMRVSSRTSLAPAPSPPAPPPASADGCTARGCGSSMSQSSLSVLDDDVDSDASAVPPKTSSRRASSAAIAWQNLPVIPPTRTYPARHGMPRADHCTPHGMGSRTAWDPARHGITHLGPMHPGEVEYMHVACVPGYACPTLDTPWLQSSVPE